MNCMFVFAKHNIIILKRGLKPTKLINDHPSIHNNMFYGMPAKYVEANQNFSHLTNRRWSEQDERKVFHVVAPHKIFQPFNSPEIQWNCGHCLMFIYVSTALFSFLESWISVPLDLDRLRDSGLLAFFHGCLQQMFTLKLVLRFRDVAKQWEMRKWCIVEWYKIPIALLKPKNCIWLQIQSLPKLICSVN